MVLNIFALLFVLGITFLHSMFGLFSGLINVFCTITAMAVGFGFAEPLNRLLTGFGLHSSYTEPFALVLLFVITLLVLRLLADRFIRGNVRVPMYLDWAGGGVCGFVIAQICVGVMVIGFLLLPWGGRVAMYQPYERDADNLMDVNREVPRVIFHENALWLRSDRFAVGLFNLLSSGSLRGKTTFASVYPDYPQWVAWTGNQVQQEALPAPLRDENRDGFDEAGLEVERWWDQTEALPEHVTRYRKVYPSERRSNPPYSPTAFRPEPGHKLIGLRLKLKKWSADVDGESAVHRFRPSNLRIVGDIVRDGGEREPAHYIATVLGGADPRIGDNYRIVDMDENFSFIALNSNTIDAFFEVHERFQPRFVEYRRHARAPVTAANKSETPPADRLALESAPGTGRGRARGRGVSRFIDTVIRNQSGDNNRLPFPIGLDHLRGSADVRGRELISVSPGSRISGFREDLLGAGQRVDRIAAPEGMGICQIRVHTRKMESLPGQVLNFVASTVNQYRAIDVPGNEHPLAGYFAVVKKDGKEYLEFFFTPEPLETGFDGMLKLSTETRRLLRQQEDAVLGLLFVVPKGTCIVSIKSQGGSLDFSDNQQCVN